MRRRFLLERAAWQLRETLSPVTEIAFDAHYASLEAFTRAFGRAFQMSPSLFRRSRIGRIHLPSPNHYHFNPTTIYPTNGTSTMDLFEIFAGADGWHTRRLLEQAVALSAEQLDHPLTNTASLFCWDKPDKDLRELLERVVETKEVWVAALTGGEMPTMGTRASAPALLQRFDKVEAEFQRFFSDVRNRGAWDETFIDAMCEPPETFTFGGVFADIVTFNAYRRLAALDAFARLGVSIPGSGSPIDYCSKHQS